MLGQDHSVYAPSQWETMLQCNIGWVHTQNDPSLCVELFRSKLDWHSPSFFHTILYHGKVLVFQWWRMSGLYVTDIILCRISFFSCIAHWWPHSCSTDSEDWKEFISKPALPFVLRLLAGLSNGHAATQGLIGREIIPVLHKLEQVSSDEHIGSLAENLMEALRDNKEVAAKVGSVSWPLTLYVDELMQERCNSSAL